MKNIESVILHCENCESLEIEGRHIGEIFIVGMKENIRRHANTVKQYRKCEDFVLEIHRDANKKYKTFGMISDDILFNRINEIPDIVSITIKYDDRTVDDNIYVSYKEKETFLINEYQHTYKSKSNHLYIVCSKDSSICDYFDLSYIDDEKAMNIHWKMIQR